MRGVDNSDLLLPQRVGDPVVLRLGSSVADDPGNTPARRLDVFVGGADAHHDDRLPIAGRSEQHARLLRFTPAFDFVPGQDYVVRTQGDGDSPPRLTEFRIPAEAPAAPAAVTAVYPSGDVLPENTLRFYVHFSTPMAPHGAADHIALHDASGKADRAALMRFKQELWSADRTRLTVLIDPGRIKRSVATNVALGPALLAGERYTLTIDGGWSSADGASTLPTHSKSFQVGAALREPPDPRRWTWRVPRPGTRQALEIAFDRPFDRHLTVAAIDVVDGDGRPIAGSSGLGPNETSWSFTPDLPWSTDHARIRVSEALEDVAGNNLRELLDREICPPRRP